MQRWRWIPVPDRPGCAAGLLARYGPSGAVGRRCARSSSQRLRQGTLSTIDLTHYRCGPAAQAPAPQGRLAAVGLRASPGCSTPLQPAPREGLRAPPRRRICRPQESRETSTVARCRPLPGVRGLQPAYVRPGSGGVNSCVRAPARPAAHGCRSIRQGIEQLVGQHHASRALGGPSRPPLKLLLPSARQLGNLKPLPPGGRPCRRWAPPGTSSVQAAQQRPTVHRAAASCLAARSPLARAGLRIRERTGMACDLPAKEVLASVNPSCRSSLSQTGGPPPPWAASRAGKVSSPRTATGPWRIAHGGRCAGRCQLRESTSGSGPCNAQSSLSGRQGHAAAFRFRALFAGPGRNGATAEAWLEETSKRSLKQPHRSSRTPIPSTPYPHGLLGISGGPCW